LLVVANALRALTIKIFFLSSIQMTKSSNPFLLNTHELPRRAGEYKEYELDIETNARIGVPLIAVPEGDVIEVDVRLESVTEGVLLSADIYAVAIGECIRCLDPVEQVVERALPL
jgi:uncharacterized protein